jgi:cytochrome c-type biogenesis protein CcmH
MTTVEGISMIRIFLAITLLIFSFSASALTTDIYSFDSPKQQKQFQNLTQQFRCLVCQNENLADSNAPLAQDLRFQIYKMVKQNKSNQDITQYLLKRYGDFVLFKPRFGKLTFILWLGPFIMLVVALLRLTWLIQTRRKKNRKFTFTKQERERIKHLLREY